MRRFGGADLVRFEQSLGPYDSEDNPFLQGQVVMMLQGPWFANLIRQRAGKLSYGVAPVPTLDGSEAGFCEQDILAIPSGAKHGRQAWRFIEWLYTAPPFCLNGNRRSTAWLLSGGPLPTETGGSSLALRPIEWLCWMHCKDFPLVEPLSAAVQTHPNPAIEVHERIARSPNIQMIPALPNWPELETEFRAAYRDIIMTDVEPGARLRACQARIDELTRLAEIRLQRYGLAYP
jgi:ABC-type glycerol-3-phosphate transport system substrate-binding protein